MSESCPEDHPKTPSINQEEQLREQSNLSEQVTSPSLVTLTLLLVSGKRSAFDFTTQQTVKEVKEGILEQWPKEWISEKPPSASNLRLLHLGRFLDDSTTLESNGIKSGQTIVHLLIRGNLQDDDDDLTKKRPSSKCGMCIVL
ncbi:uncharacterized protein VTP21DRAFT_8778 [Calcarisporiella thermophila]|uniref:uncharacterized protein n=1 Tax=Calcarisporiella thermophila TaxID=911321 RepID=UPI00374428D5